MKIEVDFKVIPVGTLLVEWLKDQHMETRGVTLDGVRVDPHLMLLAQAQGKTLSYTLHGTDEPLQPAQIAPDLVNT